MYVVGKQSAFPATEILALHFHITVADVAVGCIFPDKVQPGGLAVAAEAVAHAVRRPRQIGYRITDTVCRMCFMQRCADAPTVLDADVIADMREQHTGTGAILDAVRAGEAAPAPKFSANLDEGVGRRQPLELHAVLAQLVFPQRGICQRLIDEIPGVGMLLIEITQPGEIAAKLEIQPIAQRGCLNKGILHADPASRIKRQRGNAAIVGIDVGGNAQLRFAEIEALLVPRIGIHREAGCRNGGVLAQAAVSAAEYQRNGRVKSTFAASAGNGPGCGLCDTGLLRRCLGLGGNRFCLLAVGFGGLQTLFELRDALLVALLQLLNLLADGLQISIARGGCI